MSSNRGVMSRWVKESTSALEQLKRERDHHENALEAAMEAIRVHTQAVERLEQDIEVIETALACTSDLEPQELQHFEEFDAGMTTGVHRVGAVRSPTPPPLRPVPVARVVGER